MDPETTSPGQLMMQKVFEMLYGDCNYGMNPTGTSQAISGVSKVDIQAFIKRKLTCKNLKIFFVGDVSKSDIKTYSKILLVNVPDGDVNTPAKIGQWSSNEPSATITKENMKDVIGIAHGIRIDQLSDVEKAALRIIITAIFEGNNSDFSEGLVKSDIACKTHVKLVDRSLSTAVLLCSYIDKKDFDNFVSMSRYWYICTIITVCLTLPTVFLIYDWNSAKTEYETEMEEVFGEDWEDEIEEMEAERMYR